MDTQSFCSFCRAAAHLSSSSLGQVDVQCDTTASSKSLIACLPCSVAKERGLMAFDPPNLTRQGCKRSRKKALNLAYSLIRSQVAPSECNDDIVNCRYGTDTHTQTHIYLTKFPTLPVKLS